MALKSVELRREMPSVIPGVSTFPRLPVSILIVEDEALVRALGAGLLADAGFRVVEVTDGEAALACLVAHPEVQLLFTDVKLPGVVDGLALAREVHDRWPHVGIIITSGQSMPQTHELPVGSRFHRKPDDVTAVIRHAHELTGA